MTGSLVGLRRLVVLGMGDVTTRYVLPAVVELAEAGELPEDFELRLASRHEVTADDLADELGEHAELASHHRADATDVEELRPVIEGDTGDEGVEPVAVYLALPPTVFADALVALAEVGLAEGSRIVFEKPFGSDLASARELNARVTRCVPEHDAFRVDHFLGKQTVQQIVGTRFANRLLDASWDHAHIEAVDIVWDETLALEGRAGFYDSAGALRDMVQNHLMQLLCLVAMEPPASRAHADVADRKVEVLAAARPFHGDVGRSGTRARYTAGRVDGVAVAAYTDSDDVDPQRRTETFASITLAVDSPRWQGVPFTLRSGKALAADRHEVVVRFRPAEDLHIVGSATAANRAGEPNTGPATAQPPGNVLRFGVGPDRVELDLVVGEGADDLTIRPAALIEALDEAELGAYAVLLRDVLTGASTRSVRADEVEASWRVVQPFLDAWSADEVPLLEYPAGSTGP